MRIISRNATNRVLFKLREDPAKIRDCRAYFRQNGRTVLVKEKHEISVEQHTDRNGPYWCASVDLSVEESRLFDARSLAFVQLVVTRDYGVQDPGEIYEVDISDTLAGAVDLDTGTKPWKNDDTEGDA